MVDIVCIRGEGIHPGDDIVEPLLATVEAALARGRAELNNGALADEHTLDLVPTDLRLGNTIQVDDSVLGHWTGKAIGLSHSISIDDSGNATGSTTIRLITPREVA